MGLGPWEIFWIFLAILLIFGGKKIPEIARAMGKGMNEFNKAKREITDSVNSASEEGNKTVVMDKADFKASSESYKKSKDK